MFTCWLRLVWPVCGQYTRAPNVRAGYFSLEQGLADRDIRDILKDRQGYLWVATSKGLSRFDDYDFLTYDSRPRNPHKISLPSIYRLNLDKSGNLLIYYDSPDNDRFDLLNPLTGQLEALKFDEDLDLLELAPPFQAPTARFTPSSAKKTGGGFSASKRCNAGSQPALRCSCTVYIR